MRGKDGTIQLHELSAGITPAWAGKRNWAIGSRLLNWDHPRVGGEKLMGRPRRSVGAGSPPHRRGKAHHLDDITSERRITPAWAGKSAGFQSAPSGPRDHPRVGGEKHSGSCRTLTRSGSPPRGRGKVRFRHLVEVSLRITPAWAGKSTLGSVLVRPRRDHPRVGGEKQLLVIHHKQLRGSPPRGRGKGWPPPPLGLSPRITPPWAGKR